MIVQIYEVQTPAEAGKMVALGVDRVGSVLTDRQNWYQPLVAETIREVQRLGALSSLIPLFGDLETLLKVVDTYQPDILHLCEALVPEGEGLRRCMRLVGLQEQVKSRFPGLALMRSIPIRRTSTPGSDPTLALAKMFAPVSDCFLTDTILGDFSVSQPASFEPVDGFVGITGKTCDWDSARDLVENSSLPVILAGGISPENAARAIRWVRPAGIDSCTRTNALDDQGNPIRFKKDVQRVEALVRAAREAARQLSLPPNRT
jgi:phosphoribosylanthranilate isomerase